MGINERLRVIKLDTIDFYYVKTRMLEKVFFPLLHQKSREKTHHKLMFSSQEGLINERIKCSLRKSRNFQLFVFYEWFLQIDDRCIDR